MLTICHIVSYLVKEVFYRYTIPLEKMSKTDYMKLPHVAPLLGKDEETTFMHDDDLPPLPLPSLEDTMKK